MVQIVPDDEQAPAIVPDDDTPPAPTTWGDTLRNFREGMDASVGGVVRGIPIVGPLLDKGVNAAVAAPAALSSPTVGDVVADKPGGFTGVYNGLNAYDARIAAEHPVANTMGEVAGSTMATVPAARLFPRVFGGKTFVGQTLAGSGIGGADAFIRSGGDPDATKTGAAIGAAGPLMGQILAPVGQGLVSVGRTAVDHIPGLDKVFQPRILPAPTSEIAQAAQRGYQSLDRWPYDPASIGDLSDLIKRDLYAQSKSASIGATETHRILDTLDTLPPTAMSLHTVRKELNKVTGGDEGYSARYARDKIDQFLENPPPNAMTGGPAITGQAGPILQQANADYRAASNSEELRDRVTKAKLDAAGSNNPVPFLAEGQATRKQAKQFLDNDKASQFLLDNERQAVSDINGGSLGERAMRMVGAVSGTSRPGAFTAVPAIVTGQVAGLAPAAAGVAAGVTSNAATSALTRRAVNQADNVIRANAPYSQAYMAGQLPPRLSMSPPISQMPPSISASAHRDEIARLIALQGERSVTEPASLPPITVEEP